MKPTSVGRIACLAVLVLVAACISPVFAETISVPFTGGTAAATTSLSYSGEVWVTVSGSGTVSPTPPQNDAFYVYTDIDGLAITPFYPDPATTPDSGILLINGAPAQGLLVDPMPAFNSTHEYTFAINVPDGPISFGVADASNPADNTGSYLVTIGVPVEIDVSPKTLNLRSNGKWITAFIELPAGTDPATIDRSSLLLNGVVPAAVKPFAIGDHDEDGTPDLMVKFSRKAVKALLVPGEAVAVTIEGNLSDGTSFVGVDTIKVKQPGKKAPKH